MYFLNLHKLYKTTTPEQRQLVRKNLNRDKSMKNALKKQKNICFYCGVSVTMKDHLDHLIPVYYGGDNRLSNLVATCRDCNCIKGTQQLEITNKYTIANYQNKIRRYKKWKALYKKNPKARYWKKRDKDLYKTYHCKLFKSV